MDQQKIDRLFREKMDNLEVMPSEGAWSQVEKQIRPKKTYKVYWMAAAVTLIFASWALWPSQIQTNFTPIASEVTYPPLNGSDEFPFGEIKVAKIEEESASKKDMIYLPKKQLVAKEESTVNKTQVSLDEMAPIEIESKTTVAIAEIEQPEVIDKLINDQPVEPVKIIYIASAKNQVSEELQKTDSANTLKKFIAFAEKIDPGEVLADFKNAKDNLLNNGFKKREKNSL